MVRSLSKKEEDAQHIGFCGLTNRRHAVDNVGQVWAIRPLRELLKAHNCMKATKNIIMITFLHLRSSMQVYTFKAHTFLL